MNQADLYAHGAAADRNDLETMWQLGDVAAEAMRNLAEQIVGFGLPGTDEEVNRVLKQAWKDAYNTVKARGGDVSKLPVPE